MSSTKCQSLADIIFARHQDAVFRIALEEVRPAGINTYSYGSLDYLSDKFATVLSEAGIAKGDVLAIALSPSAAFLVAHLGALKKAVQVLPISMQTTTEQLHQVITKTNGKALVIEESRLADIELPSPMVFVVTDKVSENDFGNGQKSFWFDINFAELDLSSENLTSVDTVFLFASSEEDADSLVSVSNGEVLESLTRFSEVEANREDPPVRITGDWSQKEVLLTQVLPALFEGGL